MRRWPALLAATALALMLQSSAAHAQFSGLPNQNAWEKYLAQHPKAAAQLRSNPTLIYSPTWRSQHQELEQWLNNHPDDWRAMRQPAPWQSRWGAWDKKSDQWHDQDWWYKHRPDWAYKHHPEWWQEHKDWLAEKKEEKAEKKRQHHHHHDHDSDADDD